jgi:SOS response regulatory protein OraA/RecX
MALLKFHGMKKKDKIDSYIYKLLAAKDYSKRELCEKLKRKFEAADFEIDEIVSDLKNKGYIDDERLAKHIAEYKTKMLYGPKKIEEIFYRKGLKEYKAYIYEEFDKNTDFIKELLIEKIKKRYNALFYKNDLKLYEKLLQYLMNRGYDYDFSREIVLEVIKNESNLS